MPAVVGRLLLSIIFVLGVTVPVLGSATRVAAQASVVSFSTAEAAPADALMYMVMTLDDRSEQWRLADTLLDRAGFGEALEEAWSEELQDEAGEDLPLDAFLGGEVAIVLDPAVLDTLAEESMSTADLDAMMSDMGMATPETDATGPDVQGFAVILDARAPDTAWAGIREAARDDGGQEETYEGTTIVYAPPASADEEGMAAAKVGDLILISSSPADLHPVIDTADGRTPNITTVPEFTEARDALPAEFLSFAFVNSMADLDVDMGPFGAATEGLLVDAYSASTIAADEPGFRVETVTLVAEGETLPGVTENFDSDLDDLAPNDTLLYFSAANLGETGVLDALGAMLISLAFGMGDPSMMDPDAAQDVSSEEFIAQQYEQAAGLIGINLQTDLFQQFSGEYGGWLAANMASEEVSGLFVSGVTDTETVSNALMQLSFLIQGASGSESPLTTRDIEGGQVYVVDLGDGAGSTLEFGVVGDRFVIGNGAAIDRLAGEVGESLSGNAQFMAVMDTLPVEGYGTVYIDLAQAIPLMETASGEADDFGLGGFDEIEDASETCANYATQAEAQAAYDAGEPDTFDLDQDFDGEVCDDFFASADAADDDEDEMGSDELEEAFADIDYSAIKAYASVSHTEDGLARTSAILYISE